uniref:von Willebrand factor, type A n=1 Tax=Solibacter usitatus (strain Ellin6076) TaxID=234267 RepID=Q01X24_SOLUE
MATTLLRLTALAVVLSSACAAQLATLRVDVNLVLVPVTVTDRSGRLITGLDRSRFKILEEGVPQDIASFSTEDLPVSIGLVLDVSGSMRQKLATARAFLSALLGGAEDRDESLLLTCADRPDLQTGLTPDLERLSSLVRATRSGGSTALIDTIYLSIERMRSARNSRKVLIVVSDGQDNFSRHTRSELISRAIESEAQIYSIATPEPPHFQKAIELVDANRGLILLQDLAHATGGIYLPLDAASSTTAVAERLARTLHEQYLIGYYARDPAQKGARRIQVRLDLPDVRLYSRSHSNSPLP